MCTSSILSATNMILLSLGIVCGDISLTCSCVLNTFEAAAKGNEKLSSSSVDLLMHASIGTAHPTFELHSCLVVKFCYYGNKKAPLELLRLVRR